MPRLNEDENKDNELRPEYWSKYGYFTLKKNLKPTKVLEH